MHKFVQVEYRIITCAEGWWHHGRKCATAAAGSRCAIAPRTRVARYSSLLAPRASCLLAPRASSRFASCVLRLSSSGGTPAVVSSGCSGSRHIELLIIKYIDPFGLVRATSFSSYTLAVADLVRGDRTARVNTANINFQMRLTSI